MAEVARDDNRGPLLAEALRARAERETGDERLARARILKDIAFKLVTLTGETLDGTPFEMPPGCTWQNAAYDFRRSTASGPNPPYRAPGKVRPLDTRKTVVAYCVRIQAA